LNFGIVAYSEWASSILLFSNKPLVSEGLIV